MKIGIRDIEDYKILSFENQTGMCVELSTVGAGIRSIKVPDRSGISRTVTHCPQDGIMYRNGYHGKSIGRTSGRINGARFSLCGRTAELEKNNHGQDNLHGGAEGFHAKLFGYEINQTPEYHDVVFSYFSPDGEGGYFGNVNVKVTYRIYEKKNSFRITFDGTTDVPALLNMTNHVYLNMGGDLTENVKEQTLWLDAPRYGRLNERLIVEEVVPVPPEMDFRTPHRIGDYIYEENVQRYTKGYDHPFFLAPHTSFRPSCSLESQKSGIRLEVYTTYPCVVVYSDNYADPSVEVYPGRFDEQYLAVCLECQYHPDGIHSEPDNCGVLTPEKPYHEEIVYNFIVK